ncbi:ComF family protein [Salinimonas sp. HHU 13199]|uniref:ComF family protein n=1 Tax=Salinimonas profundi TaxID=2729140 RepID=A0ABR8LJH5_9ALTE|nr:ComF family protein [Salinimonas profundi]MBD3585728.1 ComF family protein [Salinimonas profundi]
MRKTMHLLNYSCLLCKQFSRQKICIYCKNDTRFISPHSGTNLLLNPAIARHIRHTHYSALYACGYYEWPFDRMIRALKFNHDLRYASELARWFYEHCCENATSLPQVLLPVPLPANRYWTRQFNQAGELSRQISRLSGIPTYASWAQRHRGAAQHTQNRAQRLINLRHAFKINALPPVERVAIVDDVLTTGCTADALATLIHRQAPHMQIQLWTIAVTPAPRIRPAN